MTAGPPGWKTSPGQATITESRLCRGKGAVATNTADVVVLQLDKAAVNELEASFRGEVVRPADAGYGDARRGWNGSIDRYPALIARCCAGVADVGAAVKFAKSNGLPVAVRSGGHSFPGLSVCDGGVVIDLGSMKGIRIDPVARTARVQAGVLWG